jgi:type VI secretion system protein ImpA
LVAGPLGRFSLRELESLAGSAADDAAGTSSDAVRAAFAEMPIENLRELHSSAQEGAAALLAIDQTIRSQAGVEAGPTLDPLIAQFQTLGNLLRLRLAEHPKAVAGVDSLSPAEQGEAGGGPLGAVRSRQDAIRALEAVADYFRKSEPSSPIPLLVDRAKRLVSKDFLEVMADLAPGGLPEAKSAGGIRE